MNTLKVQHKVTQQSGCFQEWENKNIKGKYMDTAIIECNGKINVKHVEYSEFKGLDCDEQDKCTNYGYK